MKKTSPTLIMIVFLCFRYSLTDGQSLAESAAITILKSYPMGITYAKTTNLIFPYAIKSVDRGSPDVLAQMAKGVDNILLVKAGSKNFPETNLTVITTDGKLYSFLVGYTSQPPFLILCQRHPNGGY